MEFPFVVAVGDGELVFGGEALDSEADAIPGPVIAEEDAAGFHDVPPGDEVLIDRSPRRGRFGATVGGHGR